MSALLKSYRHQLVRHSRYDLGEAFGRFWKCIWLILSCFKIVFVWLWTLLAFFFSVYCPILIAPLMVLVFILRTI